jgi:hypothetical protein
MEKSIRVCTLENEAESEIVCSILKEQDIPHTLIKTEDSAYDGLYASQGPWAAINAPAPYADSIVQILKDVRESRSKRTPPVVQKKGITLLQAIQIGIPIGLLIAVVILALLNIDLRNQLNRYTTREFITWKWEPSEKAMVARLISTGQIRYKDYDRNFNNIYEESAVYSTDGKRITTFYDKDEDGLKERYTVMTIEGTLIDEGQDLNENGAFEREVTYYSRTDYVEYIDVDDNGTYDKVIVHHDGHQRTIDLRNAFFADQT